MIYILVTIAALAALAAGAAWWGARRFACQAHQAQATLEKVSQARLWQPQDLQALPPVVARYLAQALPPAGGPLRMARAKMSGSIRLNAESPWQKWSGRQVWCLWPPAFVWSARMAAKPLMPVYVRDGLIKGQGGMLARLWGGFTVARAQGSPEMDLGSLQRWLAETPMFPPALLPGTGLIWQDEGPERATAVLEDHGLRVEARFSFDAQGLPRSCRIDGRPRQQADGSFATTPWLARYADWTNQGGMMVPTRCQAAWLLDEQEFCYLRVHVDQSDFF